MSGDGEMEVSGTEDEDDLNRQGSKKAPYSSSINMLVRNICNTNERTRRKLNAKDGGKRNHEIKTSSNDHESRPVSPERVR